MDKPYILDTSSIFNSAKLTAILMLDKEGNVLDLNSSFSNQFGYSKEDLIGKSFSMLFTKEDQEKGLPELELTTVLEHHSAMDENFIVHKDGTLILWE